ncbi:MAG: UDP-N-acetylmuramoyl-tripeptide--D-alanyl-D-alanine ligase [Flammeovirgaceae bacterium]|nr:MAG: UDP-N-acetylmuramoyl-tripeptide--D-alanyl-D-alanine ligase [Flammeovirgaceae bacterium]
MDIQKLYEIYRKSGKVSTDTRKIEPGSVFFALKGEKFDGNQFAGEALAKGAAYAVIDDPLYNKGEHFVVVDDVLTALQQLARHHRQQLTIPVIGLTGSNGKTTSKELLYAVLAKKFKTFATKGNLNNHIGVPLSILSIDRTIEIAVIEMGANHVGEIAALSAIANPTHGFITNIGKAHIGTFGGFDNIIRGKSELYMHLINNQGTVFINSQNPILFNMAKRFKNPVLYPAKGDYYHCEMISANPYIKIRTESGREVQTKLLGTYNFENIATALCIGKYFGVDENLANQAVADYEPANMRSQVIKKGTNTIILDAYNANPSSMEAAIRSLADMKAEKKVLILGDMFELEEEAEQEHRNIGKLVRDLGFTSVLLCGDLMRYALDEFPRARYFSEKEDLLSSLKQNPISESTVLVKASRGIGLEAVMDVI